MTAHWTVRAVIGCKLKQNANEGCNSCASLAGLVLSFIACFILLVIALNPHHNYYKTRKKPYKTQKTRHAVQWISRLLPERVPDRQAWDVEPPISFQPVSFNAVVIVV